MAAIVPPLNPTPAMSDLFLPEEFLNELLDRSFALGNNFLLRKALSRSEARPEGKIWLLNNPQEQYRAAMQQRFGLGGDAQVTIDLATGRILRLRLTEGSEYLGAVHAFLQRKNVREDDVVYFQGLGVTEFEGYERPINGIWFERRIHEEGDDWEWF